MERDPQEPARLKEQDGEVGRLLRSLPPADPPEGARARVWRQVSAGMGPSRGRRWPWLLVAPAAAALSVAAVVALLPGRTKVAPAEPVPVLALSSGPVEVLSPFRVRTGPGGRALLRAGRAAVLLDEGSEVEARGAEVVVFGGRVALAVLDDGPLVLRAGDQSLSRAGVFALLVASSRVEWAEATPDERRLLDALGRPAPEEAVLAVEAPPGYEVGMDGVPLGGTPVRVLAAPGVRRLAGRLESSELTLAAQVTSGQENRYVLRPPAPPDSESRQEPTRTGLPPARRRRAAPPVAPVTPATKEAPPAPPAPAEAETPATGGLLAPEPALRGQLSSAVSGHDADAASYALAKQLLEQGRHAEAAGLFSAVARGQGSRAELSLYELGRLNLRHLKDPAAAQQAFQGYLDRYPRGLLVQEVELSLMESQLSAGALDRAGESMDRFLQRHPRSERRHEVLLLRANLDRDRGDCAGALERYRALFEAPGAIGDDATYFAAVCAQRAGRADEARRLLERYLLRFPSGRHHEAARGALR